MDNKLTNLTTHERNFIFGFKKFKTKILSDIYTMFKEEDVYGQSDKIYSIWLYHSLNMFGMLMKLRLNEWKDYSRLKTFFDFESIRKCLACKNIKFQDILDVYNLKDETKEGISKIKINKTLKVGSEHYLDSFKEDLDYYLNLKDNCSLFLDAQNRGLAIDATTGLEIKSQTLIQV